MTDAIILQTLGLLYLVIAVGVLLNSQFYKDLFFSFAESKMVFYILGSIVFVLGYLFVSFHNTWTSGWNVIVTILGWLLLLKGIMVLVFPGHAMKIAKIMGGKNLKVVGWLVLLLGVAFAYLGFMVV